MSHESWSNGYLLGNEKLLKLCKDAANANCHVSHGIICLLITTNVTCQSYDVPSLIEFKEAKVHEKAKINQHYMQLL